ncbi:MAG: Gldg family protein [Spirochaetales bacterium]|nr:Gldg family protein [Spirochaetales bacterium]
MKLKFILYVAVLVLLNIAATTLFFRVDITENKSYSLSDSSTELVKNLEEPLTIKVFLSENLPVPYNSLERDIRDILMEYKLQANKHFNYTIDIIKKDETPKNDPSTYNIYPVNIQNIEQDEMKVVSAYLGMAFIHGDMIETIPAIDYNKNLELIITNTIRKLTEKTTFLLGMEENIHTILYISPALYGLSSDLEKYSDELEKVIGTLNKEFYNRVDFKLVEPSEMEIDDISSKFGISTLKLQDENENTTTAIASVVINNGSESSVINLIGQDIFGRTVVSGIDELQDGIKSNIEKMIGTETRVGYLTSNGTIPLTQDQMAIFSGNQEPGLNSLTSIINSNYTLSAIDLKDGQIRDDIKTLIIARPSQKFTDRELFLLDQFLLKGNSILLALDQITMDMEKSNPNYGQEAYKLMDHGLINLLKNYGINVSESMIMDVNSFKQVQKDSNGSLKESQIYFAPVISSQNINTKLPFLKGLTELITFRMSEISPVDNNENSIKTLFSTSDKAWAQQIEGLSLNPSRIFPASEKSSYSLGVIKEGSFKSYFANTEIPQKEIKDNEPDVNESLIAGVKDEEKLISESSKGTLIVLGSSDLLTDSLIGNSFPSNTLLIQNLIDYASGRGEYIEMRSKGVLNRPMITTSSIQRNFIKYFNILGLPLLVAIAGITSYFIWLNRKKKIMGLFMEDRSEK